MRKFCKNDNKNYCLPLLSSFSPRDSFYQLFQTAAAAATAWDAAAAAAPAVAAAAATPGVAAAPWCIERETFFSIFRVRAGDK